jgi:hypothetical protein
LENVFRELEKFFPILGNNTAGPHLGWFNKEWQSTEPFLATCPAFARSLLYGFVGSDIGLRLLKLSKGPKKDVSTEAMM